MAPPELSPPFWKRRWTQLALSALATVMLASLQYGWTLFVNPIHDANGWSRAAIQVAFTILISVNTWLSPLEGWLVDRYGPRPVVMVGGICAALSWVIDSRAQSLPVLYTAAMVGGLALGCVFGTCMGTALKWFPDRRGLAAGAIAAGYGLGAAVMTIPLARMIRASGYRHTFFLYGLIQGAVIFLLGILLVKPYVTAAMAKPRAAICEGPELKPSQTIRTGVFWLTYAVYLLIAFGGMVMTAQLGPIARDFGLENRIVTLFGISAPVLTVAVSIDNFANGITRPIAGFVSDIIGRENMMLLMFSLEAVALAGMAFAGRSPYGFLVFAGLTFLFWGEIFVIFPAICGDSFGIRNAAANNGLLYTAKGMSSLAVPLASVLVSATGTWNSVLIAASISSLMAGLLARFVLSGMRRRMRQMHSKTAQA
ncbi:MAG TPA: oxalate/formate MFS antiporter [Bryobacteraceae bacterium]|nr:oxalate/formate MFS antiporter [Bryobacteraceae bacterium]